MNLDLGQTKNALGIADYHAPNAPMMRDIANPAMVKHGIGWAALTGITAAELAAEAEFFSFGTNDLTQTTFGYSRDDIGGFLQGGPQQPVTVADGRAGGLRGLQARAAGELEREDRKSVV